MNIATAVAPVITADHDAMRRALRRIALGKRANYYLNGT